MRRLILPFITAAAALGSPVATFGEDPAAPAPDEPALARLISALVAEPPPQRAPTGDVKVVRAFTDFWGIPCRDFVQTVQIGEDIVSATGTMCRAANGSWILQRE